MSLLQNAKNKTRSSFRASEARPGIQNFQVILDSGFRRNDGVSNFCKSLRMKADCGLKFAIPHFSFRIPESAFRNFLYPTHRTKVSNGSRSLRN